MAAMTGSERNLRKDILAADQRRNNPNLAPVAEWQGRIGNLSMVCRTTSDGSNE